MLSNFLRLEKAPFVNESYSGDAVLKRPDSSPLPCSEKAHMAAKKLPQGSLMVNTLTKALSVFTHLNKS